MADTGVGPFEKHGGLHSARQYVGSYTQGANPTFIKLGASVTIADRYSAFNLEDGTAYQVPSNRKLVILSLCIVNSISSSEGAAQIAYGDNDIGNDSAAAMTNEVRAYGVASGTTPHIAVSQTGVGSGGMAGKAFFFQVPANKFVSARLFSAAEQFIEAWGWEVDA